MVEFSVRFWETEIRSTTIDSLYSRIPPTVGRGFVVSRVLRLSLIFTSHVTSTEHHPPNAKSPRVSQIKRTCRPAASIVYNLGRSGKSSVIINAISNRFQSRPCAKSVINTGVELILCKSLRPRKF